MLNSYYHTFQTKLSSSSVNLNQIERFDDAHEYERNVLIGIRFEDELSIV